MATYAVLADLTTFGGNPSGTTAQQQAALDAANALADGYLGAKFRLPLTAWGKDLTQKVVAVARFELLMVRGFNPEGHAAEAIKIAYDAAIRWFEKIADGAITPTVTDSGPAGRTGGAFVEQGVTDDENPGRFVINKPAKNRDW
jgi:phage gp36-like protein